MSAAISKKARKAPTGSDECSDIEKKQGKHQPAQMSEAISKKSKESANRLR
jgi:hypothetical protein